MAEQENINRSTRAFEGYQHRIKIGQCPHRPPTGYVREKRTKALLLHLVLAPLVQKAFSLVASGSHSAESARRALRKENFKVTKSTFYNILHNIFYAGYSYYIESDGKTKTLMLGNHPALITLETFYLVQQQLAKRGKTGLLHIKRRSEYPLRGRLTCPKCENKLTAGKSKSRNKSYYYYYNCQRKFIKCTLNLPVQRVHDLFDSVILNFGFSSNITKVYETILKNHFNVEDAETQNRILAITNELKEIKDEKVKLVQSKVRQEITQLEFEEARNDYDERTKVLIDELSFLESKPSSYSMYIQDNKPALASFKDFFWKSHLDTKSENLDLIFVGDLKISNEKVEEAEINKNFELITYSKKQLAII